ncbi:MAG: alpha/beta family hydrolase [Flammeovirgaceae bacterium]
MAHQTIASAIVRAQQLFPTLPVFASGKSFGGRMSSQWLALQTNNQVKGIIFFGFPLHPAGKPGTERAEHLENIKLPKLFLQGTKDELARWDLLTSVIGDLRDSTLIELPGADHAFKRGKENLVPLLAQQTSNWVRQILLAEK